MKNILITGATDGIGLETSKLLAQQGHNLVIHGRSEDKLESTILILQSINPKITIKGCLADLSDFSQVRQLISEIKANNKKIDVIVNNAGVLKTNTPLTESGLDVRFVVNTISPYLITQQLLPILADDGRIVNLSSAAQAPVDINALLGKHIIEDDFQAYSQSKLAITIWSQQLANRLNSNQLVVAVNPGSLLASKMVKKGFGVAGNDLSIGADILVRASLSDEFSTSSGQYFDNDSKKFANPHSEAADKEKCDRLMTAIEQVISLYS